MGLLKPQDQLALKKKFEQELVGDVTLTLFTTSRAGLALPGADCETCEATQQLLEELSALDPRIHLKVRSIVTDAEEARPGRVTTASPRGWSSRSWWRASWRLPARTAGSSRRPGRPWRA
jgi:hypothetical protein